MDGGLQAHIEHSGAHIIEAEGHVPVWWMLFCNEGLCLGHKVGGCLGEAFETFYRVKLEWELNEIYMQVSKVSILFRDIRNGETSA